MVQSCGVFQTALESTITAANSTKSLMATKNRSESRIWHLLLGVYAVRTSPFTVSVVTVPLFTKGGQTCLNIRYLWYIRLKGLHLVFFVVSLFTTMKKREAKAVSRFTSNIPNTFPNSSNRLIFFISLFHLLGHFLALMSQCQSQKPSSKISKCFITESSFPKPLNI